MEQRQRKNHRLQNFDYGSEGYYYITICTAQRSPLLSQITVGSDALVAPSYDASLYCDALVAPSYDASLYCDALVAPSCDASLYCDALVTPSYDAMHSPDALLTPNQDPSMEVKTTPTTIGKQVISCWENIARRNENIELDSFVLMPNHIHGIIIIKNVEPMDAVPKTFGFEIAERRGRRSLQGVVKDFKSVTTRHYKKITGATTSLWQDSFYDEIIRDQAHYDAICQYITNNPLRWKEDNLYRP